jgi:hypothetical protein
MEKLDGGDLFDYIQSMPEKRLSERQSKSQINGFEQTHTVLHSVHRCQNWAGRLLVG